MHWARGVPYVLCALKDPKCQASKEVSSRQEPCSWSQLKAGSFCNKDDENSQMLMQGRWKEVGERTILSARWLKMVFNTSQHWAWTYKNFTKFPHQQCASFQTTKHLKKCITAVCVKAKMLIFMGIPQPQVPVPISHHWNACLPTPSSLHYSDGNLFFILKIHSVPSWWGRGTDTWSC